ncbi:MAG: hypothetical protein ACI9IL_000769 [Rickettsiales bacterium]|jgi:hypothetical protein
MIRNLIFILIAIFYSNVSFSAQLIKVSPDISVKANISAYELNRLNISGGKILDIIVKKGDLIIDRNKETNDIYLSLPYSKSRSIINIFVVSESNHTYQLLLIPKRIPSEQIFLIENSIDDKKLQIKDDYRDEIISFYKTIYNKELHPDYKISKSKRRFKDLSKNQKRQFRKNKIKLYKTLSYTPKSHSGLYGKIIEVYNKSKKDFKLKEEHFSNNHIKAIKFNEDVIKPGKRTLAYLISIKND